MGIGHHRNKQGSFFNSNGVFKLSHGGELRKKKRGRGLRPLSTKEPLHTVFKVTQHHLRHKSLRAPESFKLVLEIMDKYAKYFAVKIEQISVQNDHIHLLIRTSRRKCYLNFFRVVAGQIAQRFEKTGLLAMKANLNFRVTDTPKLWKYRPFSRVVRGWKSYKVVRNYIQLNEKEALGVIKYQKKRLRGLSTSDWQLLWVT